MIFELLIVVTVTGCLLQLIHVTYAAWKAQRELRLDFDSLRRHVSPKNDIQSAFLEILDIDGAGDWPPRVSQDGWPIPFQPYKEIFLELAPYFSTNRPSLDDDTNILRMKEVRDAMKVLLSARVNLSEIENILAQVESGGQYLFPAECYNGFYSCLGFLRHTYRWTTNPIVKAAQLESTIDLPDELDIPWQYMQRHFGFTSESGTVMSNIILNVDRNKQPIYKINYHPSDDLEKTDRNFYLMFHDIERLSIPVYCAMVHSITQFNDANKSSCQRYMACLSQEVSAIFDSFRNSMHDSKMTQSIWLQYIQGFHAWAAGRLKGDMLHTYSGLSGGHTLIIQALDAFLGLEPLFPEYQLEYYVSISQRRFFSLLRKCCIRERLGESEEDLAIQAQFDVIVKQMKRFRATHRARVLTYLDVPAPERLPMTTTLSVSKSTNCEADRREALREVGAFLEKRLKQTK